MPVLFHLSDLHFGPAFNEHLAELILQDLESEHPDLVIVSGDWTMRGRVTEYEQARAYLQKLPKPVLTIPGNHDQPLHWAGLFERLVSPWSRYRQFIHTETDVVYQAPGLFVVGLNDNHNIIPGGIWSAAQRRWMEKELSAAPASSFKILVMHHHLLWNGAWRPAGQWFPTRTLNRLASFVVELVLNGHTHIPLVRATPQGIVIAQSGTTMSGRTRQGHGNTYNRITVDAAQMQIDTYAYDEPLDRFVVRAHAAFPRKTRVTDEH